MSLIRIYVEFEPVNGMPSKKKRKRKYIPHKAAAKFKPNEDWSHDEARKLHEQSIPSFEVDRIHFSDCIKGMKHLPDESIDTVIADPPFGISFSGKEALYNRDESLVIDGYEEIEGDYRKFTHAWVSELPRIMKKKGSAWIFSGWTNLLPVLEAVEKTKLHLINHIIWKYQFGVFTRKKFVTSHYHLLFLTKRKRYYFNKIEHYPEDVWEINRTYMKGEKKNGTKLPNELVMRCIDFTSRPGAIIFDPFMGNGTTAVAAKGSYRHFLGFEKNKAMQKIIEHNLSLVKLGEFYIPYSERVTELVRKAREKFGDLEEN